MDKDKTTIKKQIVNHLGKVGIAIISVALLTPTAAQASDSAQTAKEVLATEGGKQALNQALKVARSKPALTVASTIVCAACIPVAGASASASMCIACGILIAKVIG